jgi:prophage tail gpP-like protein
MATFKVTGGEADDAVRIILDEQECLMVEEYEVSMAFMQVPHAFSITVGHGSTALDIMQQYPKNTRFRCMIGPVTVFSGRTDGFRRASQSATQIMLSGRDAMARLVRDHITEDHSFTHSTFEEVVRYAIEGAGIKGYSLTFDTNAQRLAVTGKAITKSTTVTREANPNDLRGLSIEPVKGQDLRFTPLDIQLPQITETITKITGYRSDSPIEFKVGQTWFEAVHGELEKGGLFLRAGVDPEGIDEFTFVLGAPSAEQSPLYALVNARGAFDGNNVVNVQQPQFSDIAIQRCAHYIIYGAKGGGKGGRSKVEGRFDDQEMIDAGYVETYAAKSDKVKSIEHATFLARKMAASHRMRERSLVYPYPTGHTVALGRDPTQRTVFAPDTVVYVRDDEHGIDSNFWVERVHMKGGKNGRSTDLTLHYPEDLIFGDGGFSVQKGKKKGGSKARAGGRQVFGKGVSSVAVPRVGRK